MSRVIRTFEDYKKHPDYNKCLDVWSENFINILKRVFKARDSKQSFWKSRCYEKYNVKSRWA
jgi:hypothetical protein